jgi:hypothetical protein
MTMRSMLESVLVFINTEIIPLNSNMPLCTFIPYKSTCFCLNVPDFPQVFKLLKLSILDCHYERSKIVAIFQNYWVFRHSL